MEIIQAMQTSGLDNQKSEILRSKFEDFSVKIGEWKAKTSELVITNESQTAEIMTAKEGHKFMRGVRIDIEKTRKNLKEDSLKEGRAIDLVAKLLIEQITPIEIDLQQKAKFIEIQEENRRAKITQSRIVKLTELGYAIPNISIISETTDEMFEIFLSGLKTEAEKRESDLQASEKIRIEAEQKAEQERLECERIEKEHKESQRKENERLKIEAEKREAEIAEERKANEKIRLEQEAENKRIQAEKDELIRIEEERKTQEQVEELNRLEAERKQKSAPDRERILYYINALECELVSIPQLENSDLDRFIIVQILNPIEQIIANARLKFQDL